MGLEEQVAALDARVGELERRLRALDHAATAPALPPPPPRVGPPAPAPPPAPPPPPGPESPRAARRSAPDDRSSVPNKESRSRPRWVNTETLLKWAGLVLVVLAAIFFVGTAINRGWISPELQLAGATIGGLLLIAGGFRLIDSSRPWAAALASGGAVVVAVCAAAANGGLDLIEEYPALALLAVVTVGLAWVARRLSVELVATATGLSAAFLPLWIVEDVDLPPLVLAGWMTVLAVAATGFGWSRGWPASRLLTVGVSGAVLLLLAAAEDELPTGQKGIAVVAVAGVAAMAWAGPAYPAITGSAMAGRWRAFDHRSVLSIPIWTWAITELVVGLGTDRSVAALGFGIAAAFAFLALISWARLPLTLATAHLLGIGILVALSLAILIDGPGLLVALAAQAAATVVVARTFDDRWLWALAAVLGAIATAWAAQATLVGVFEEQTVGELLANLFVIALLVAWTYDSHRRSDEIMTVPLALVSWVGVLGWIASAFGHRPQGQVIVSLLWSAMAAAALIIGVRAGDHRSRALGIVTLVVVLVKLLTVDLAEVDTLWRVGLFLVVGGGLLRLGYVLPRLSTAEDSQLR